MKRAMLALYSGVIGLLLLLTLVQSSSIRVSNASTVQPKPADPVVLRQLQTRYHALSKQLAQLMPAQPYILVDTARNHLYIRHRDRVMVDALASTRSEERRVGKECRSR